MPEIKAFREDAKRWLDESHYPSDGELSRKEIRNRDIVRLCWLHPGLGATAVFRAASWSRRHGIRGLPRLLEWLNVLAFGIEMSSRMTVGPGLYIAHPVGMVLVSDRIGANASFVASVTLGMRNSHEFPRLGDGVFVGAGARVLGGISVGDGCRVGANAVLIENAAAGSTLVGIPARPIGPGLNQRNRPSTGAVEDELYLSRL